MPLRLALCLHCPNRTLKPYFAGPVPVFPIGPRDTGVRKLLTPAATASRFIALPQDTAASCSRVTDQDEEGRTQAIDANGAHSRRSAGRHPRSIRSVTSKSRAQLFSKKAQGVNEFRNSEIVGKKKARKSFLEKEEGQARTFETVKEEIADVKCYSS